MLTRILKDSVVYGLSGGLGRAASLLMAPILTRLLLPADYGLVDGIIITVDLLVLLAALNVDSAMVRYYYESEDRRTQYDVANTSFWALVVLGLVILAVTLPLAPTVSRLLFKTTDHAELVRLGLLTVPFQLLVYHFQTVLQVQRRPRLYFALSTVSLIVGVVLTLGLVAGLRWGVRGMIAASLAGAVFNAGLYLAFLRPVYRLGYSPARLRAMLSYSLPMFPGSLLFWVNGFSNRLFLLRFATVGALGLYAIGTKVAQPVGLAIMAYQAAWRPYAMAAIGRPGDKELYVRSFSLYLGLAVLLGGAVALFAPEVLQVLATPPYYEARTVVGILCLAVVVQGAGNHLAQGILVSGRTKYFSLARALGTAAILMLNASLIPPLGLVGAALPVLAGELVICGVYYYWAQRLYPVPYTMGRALLGLGLLGAIAMLGALPTGGFHLLEALAAKGVVVALYASIVYGTMLSRSQHERIRGLFRRLVPARPR